MSETSSNYRIKDPRTEPALLRRRDVEAKTGLSKTTMYRLMRDGDFPRPVAIAKRAVAWRVADLNTWLAKLDARSVRP